MLQHWQSFYPHFHIRFLRCWCLVCKQNEHLASAHSVCQDCFNFLPELSADHANQHQLASLCSLHYSLRHSIHRTKCLAGGIGLTQLHFFLGTIYLPLLAFCYLYVKIRREPTMSVRRNELEEIFGFLLLLWYSPLLQSVGQMFKCYNDPTLGGWVLVSDPRVSCEVGTARYIVILHAFLIYTIIGVGLPLAIFVTTRRLRARGELRADSPLASIFEVSTERSEPKRNHI